MSSSKPSLLPLVSSLLCVCTYVFTYVLTYVEFVWCLYVMPDVSFYFINTGNVSKVLPDYEKSHVMSLIISYIPEHSADDHNDLKYACI